MTNSEQIFQESTGATQYVQGEKLKLKCVLTVHVQEKCIGNESLCFS